MKSKLAHIIIRISDLISGCFFPVKSEEEISQWWDFPPLLPLVV